MEVAFDDSAADKLPTLMLSVLVGRREGGFVMAPRASLHDGRLDYVHCGDLSRWEVMKLLPRLAFAGPPDAYPKVKQGQCRKVKVTSTAPLIIHVDGEFFCRPEDDVRSVEIEVIPAALTIVGI